MKILALITAKSASKRVPNKNKKIIGGKALYKWTVDYLLSLKHEFEDIALSSDRPDEFVVPGSIAKIIRPKILCEDCSPHVLSVRHALNKMEAKLNKEYDYVILFQPTNPIRDKDDLYAMLAMLQENKPMLGKTYYIDENLHSSYIEGVRGWIEGYLDRSGNGVLIRSGSMYAYARRYLIDTGIPRDELDTVYVPIPKYRGYNLNNIEDFAIVQTFMEHYHCKDK